MTGVSSKYHNGKSARVILGNIPVQPSAGVGHGQPEEFPGHDLAPQEDAAEEDVKGDAFEDEGGQDQRGGRAGLDSQGPPLSVGLEGADQADHT